MGEGRLLGKAKALGWFEAKGKGLWAELLEVIAEDAGFVVGWAACFPTHAPKDGA
jgi:hypothetical protein